VFPCRLQELAELQETTASALCYLTTTEPHRSAVVASGAIPALVDIVSSERPGLMEEDEPAALAATQAGASALAALASCQEGQDALRAGGGRERIIGALEGPFASACRVLAAVLEGGLQTRLLAGELQPSSQPPQSDP
jgi:hypothetical protein